MKSSPPRLYAYGSVRFTGGEEVGRIVRVAGTNRFTPFGSISTPATKPPENGNRSLRETGVNVTVSGRTSASAGISRVNVVPSAPVAVTLPPFSSRFAEPACAVSSTGDTEYPPRSAEVSPTEANVPEGLTYFL